MNDLIRKEEVINIIHNKIQSTSDFLQHDVLIDVEFEVDELPTVESKEVVRGEWIQQTDFDENDNANFICTNCFHGDIHAKDTEVPFCWFCGANMRKKVTE